MTLVADIDPRKVIDWTSYSGLTLHRKCPQAWHYRYMLGLSRPPKSEAKPELHFGNWWHALRAADSIERGRAHGTLKYAPKKGIRCTDDGPRIMPWNEDGTENTGLVEQVFEAIEHWQESIPDEHIAEWKSKLGSDSPSRLLRSLNARYTRQHKDEILNEHPVGVEVKWTRQLPGLETVLLGYTDEVFLDVKRNLTVVRDHKTTKQLSSYGSAEDDLLDSQLDLNAWGLMEVVAAWGIPPVQAIAFDRVCSVKPTTPKLIKSGKLSKTVTNFDLMTYMAFCQSDAAKEAGYLPEPSQIERISAPAYQTRWFQRTLRPLNRNIVKAHLQAAVDSQQDAGRTIQRALKRGEAPRNMTGAACKFCDFAKLCRAQMVGGADGEYDVAEYALRHKASEKLEDAATSGRLA